MYQTVQEASRGAFALNNLGVHLLARQCYLQAHDTLRDAAFVIMVVAKNKREGIIDVRECDVSELLTDAYRRFSKPQGSSSCAYHPGLLVGESALTPIQLESEEYDMESERDLGVVASVVAYNSALSHLRLSYCSDYGHASEDLLCLAQRFFQTAYFLLFMSLPEVDGRCTPSHVLSCVIRVITGLIESVKDIPAELLVNSWVSGSDIGQLNLVVMELQQWYRESASASVGAPAA
jgi:hypothetical protein